MYLLNIPTRSFWCCTHLHTYLKINLFILMLSYYHKDLLLDSIIPLHAHRCTRSWPCLLLLSFFGVVVRVGGTVFNTSLLQTYIHGALEDMRHWYSQRFISHKHGMNEHTAKREVDESICLQKKKKRFVRLPPGRETWTWAIHLSIVFLCFVSV